MNSNEIPPGNTDILPQLRVGKLTLLNFMSTVRIEHRISDCRNEIVGEIPKPYQPQPRKWWADRVSEHVTEYRSKTGY